MTAQDYMKILVEDLHSAVVSTIGDDGHPETRTIDMMLWDDKGVYFLTAKGKNFYKQLMEQKYLALTAVKDKKSISLRGRIRNIGTGKLNEIFEKKSIRKAPAVLWKSSSCMKAAANILTSAFHPM